MAATLDARIRVDSSQYSGAMNRIVRETNSAVGKVSAQFNSLRNIFAGGVVGAYGTQFLGGIMEATIQAEKLRASLSATTGNSLLGAKQFEDLKKVSAEIGINVEAAAKSMIQLQSAGLGAADSMRFIKASFNAVQSSGGGSEEFKRVAYSMQQMLSAGRFLQEDINILREALPTAGALMKEAFGANRAEDLQKLNISTKDFVRGIMEAMEKLPQLADTLEKKIGRTRAQWDALKASVGEMLAPSAGVGLKAGDQLIKLTQWVRDQQADAFEMLRGGDPAKRRQEEAMATKILEILRATKQARQEEAEAATKAAASRDKSIEQGRTLRGVYEKLADTINRLGKEYLRANLAEEAFEDGMRRAADQERNDAWEAAADATRRQLSDAIMAKREAAGEAFNEFVGPQQMSDEERDAWRQRVDAQSMAREDRRALRAQDREERRNTRKAADEQARKELREAKEEARKNAFDDLKKNRGFFNEEQTKANLRDQNRKAAKEAVESAAKTLTDIRDILKTLATA